MTEAALDRRLPWENLTYEATRDDLNSSQLLRDADLNWDVAIRPLWRRLNDGSFVQHPRSREVYRTDTEEPLGTVKGHYQVFQNRDAFAFGDALVENGDARWVEAGQQGNGFRVFMTMKIGDGFTVAGEDEYQTYLFLRTSHDGSTGVHAHVVPFRVFCLNQMALVHQKAISSWAVPHTTNVAERVTEARESLKLVGVYTTALTATLERLAGVKVTEDQVLKLINGVVSQRRARRDDVVNEMFTAYQTSPTVAPYRGTAYGVLNAVTEYLDHLKPQRNANARFESIMFGEGNRARNDLMKVMAELL